MYRYKGINFTLLSVYDTLGYQVEIIENQENIETSRALNVKTNYKFQFEHVYVDFDECLIIKSKINTNLIAHLYHFRNQGKSIYLITKHEKDICETVDHYRISKKLFDSLIQLDQKQEKWKHISYSDAIFIDDSFSERMKVHFNLKIPVLAPDAVNFI